MRKTRGMTQVQLCARAGLTQGSLSAIERGDTRALKAETLLRLARALSVNHEWLQTGRETPVQPLVLSIEETELVALFRQLPESGRDEVLRHARAIHHMLAPKPSAVAPFRRVIPTP